MSALGPIQKAGWGAVRFRPDTKSRGGAGCAVHFRHNSKGGGRGGGGGVG